MEARALYVTFDVIDNISSRLDEIMPRLDSLTSTTYSIPIESKGITQAGEKATVAMNNTANATKQVTNATDQVRDKSVGAFKELGASVNEAGSAVLKLVGSLALIAAGGAIAGMPWLERQKLALYKEEIYGIIDANKKWGFTSDELKSKVSGMIAAAPGWATSSSATKEMIGIMAVGGEKLGKGEKGLTNAEAIMKGYFKYQEVIQEQGFASAEDLVTRAMRTEGELKGFRALPFKKMGFTDEDLKSSEARLKKLMSMGQGVNIQVELDKRPWVAVENNIKNIKNAIGDSLAKPLMVVTTIAAKFVSVLTAIPGLPMLIGLAGILATLAGVFALVSTAATAISGVFISAGVAAGLLTASETAVAFAGWAAIAPILAIALPLAALIGILVLAEQKTHVFSKAFEKLRETQLAKDVIEFATNSIKKLGEAFGWAMAQLESPAALEFFEYINAAIGNTITQIDKIYTTIKKGDLKEILSVDFGKLVIDVLGKTIFFPIKLFTDIWLTLSKIWYEALGLNKLFNKAIDIWNKVKDFISWLWGTLKLVHSTLTSSFDKLLAFFGYETEAGKERRLKAENEERVKRGEAPLKSVKDLKPLPTFGENMKGVGEIIGKAIAVELAKTIATIPAAVVEGIANYFGVGNYTEKTADKLGEPPVTGGLGATPIGKIFGEGMDWLGKKVGGGIAEWGKIPLRSYFDAEGTSLYEATRPSGERKSFYDVQEALTWRDTPEAHTGGLVKKSGLAIIEKGESIIAADRSTVNTVYVDLGGIRIDKVSSEVDIEKLMRRMDKQIRDTVKYAIGQRRGG